MKTRYAVLREEDIDSTIIEEAGRILREGGLVAFPTETVYGLGGDALQAASSRKIYEAKGRPSDNPLIVHICRMEDLPAIVEEIPRQALILAGAFWPGPLTMIFHKSELVPPETTGGLSTVAVRFPSNKIAMALIDAAGGYVAAPSANRSGRPSPTLARYCKEDLDGRVDMILDGGEVGIGLESTIIDLTTDRPMILRPGYITEAMLEDLLGPVSVDNAVLDPSSGQAPKAPGMKYRHYAPRGILTIVDGDERSRAAYINRETQKARKEGKRVGVICTDETAGLYAADLVRSAGTLRDIRTIARNLFRILREFDDADLPVLYAEAFPEEGLGAAVMNRLRKAAGQRIVRADGQSGQETLF